MKLRTLLAASAATFATATAVTAPLNVAAAQQITGAIRGTVTDEAGNAVPGASVTVINRNTGFQRTLTTGSTGQFTARNLDIGGDYEVQVTASGFGGQRAEDIGIALGSTTDLDFALQSAAVSDEIVVTGTRSVVDVAAGPNATFNLQTLQSVPAINRSITDVVRLDPRLFVDESRNGVDPIQCGGRNPRFNSLTVDGVRFNDGFGLNSNGYPTERQPFSFDAIEEVAVELAPFDVRYGGFSACNINAVTKSGSNEFHGTAFIDYTDDGLRGDSLEGDEINGGEYDEVRWGIGVGGPIIQDTLFFYANYERLEGANLFDRGPLGSGAVNEVDLTQAELEEILQISRDVYGYEPGGVPSSFDNEDEKVIAKLDWNVTDGHRASFTYTYNDGFNIVPSDGDNDEFEFSNHLYERGAKLESYVGSLFSDWTDDFSTELRYGYTKLDNRQISIGGTDFGEIRVTLADREGLDDLDVYLGGDDSRQSNVLNYDVNTFVARGFYTSGNQTATFGYEYEGVDIFNLFVQHTETEIRFDGIDNFRDGFADAIYYNNAPSNNPADAAADWGYAVHALYLQDEIDFLNGFVVTAGLRYDWYTSNDRPETNQDFLADYGFSNNQTVDGEGLLQPRISFEWDTTDRLDIRGGVGVYSGGNPNVWLSNTYSANNVLQFGQRGRSFGYTDGSRSLFDDDVEYALCEDGVPSGPGYCVPQELVDAVANGVGDNFEINYLDPKFEIPREIKVNLGLTADMDLGPLGDGYIVTADALYGVAQKSAIWKRGDLVQTGTTTGPIGGQYPAYDSVREAAFVLTNSGTDAESLLLSAGIQKSWDFGLDVALGYAYSDSEDINPMTSSVAFSNYVFRAFTDPQEEIASTSDWNIQHRFTALASYEQAFFGDYATRFTLAGFANEGQPYSLVLTGAEGTADAYGFTPFLDFVENVLVPGGERNEFSSGWWAKADLTIEQELPGFRPDDRTSVFVTVDNITNLLNDEWGILREASPTVDYRDSSPFARQGDASRYEIRFGARYEF